MVDDSKVCPQCAETVRSEAKVCKHCGHDFYAQAAVDDHSAEPKKKGGLLKKALGCFALLFIGFIILGIIAVNSADDDDKATSATTEESAEADPNSGVSKSNFAKIKTGMTLDEVSEILGPGELSTEMGIGDTDATIYQWGNAVFGGVIIVTFIDGKVSSKSQAGL